ncbi:MAG: hypothetical protein ORN27_09825, partial [Rhodoluna sp.]|nr:hypothetical protein [Rhodoluna sp.]
MATYFSALEAARESLGLGGDLTALNMVLAKHPNLKTEDELANMFATRGNMALSSQQLADLVAIIAFVTPAPIVVEEAPEVDVLDELDDELDEVDDLDDHDLDAPAAPTMASVPVEDEVEPG